MIVNSDQNYIGTCRDAANDENSFNNFKNNQFYRTVLEHVSQFSGQEYLDKIKKNKYYENLIWNDFFKNDLFGNPIKYLYDINGISCEVSPTTLRYVSIGLDIMDFIENLKLNNLNIVEIGCGYGGQYKILMDLCKIYNININRYKLIDIPEISQLQKKYLNNLNYNDIIFETCYDFNIEIHDLLISNYALGELLTSVQEEYIEKVVKYCSHYYMIWNTPNINDYFKDATIIPEIPMTGSDNKVIYK